eukprot:6441314-Prymnesium_polylepis.1
MQHRPPPACAAIHVHTCHGDAPRARGPARVSAPSHTPSRAACELAVARRDSTLGALAVNAHASSALWECSVLLLARHSAHPPDRPRPRDQPAREPACARSAPPPRRPQTGLLCSRRGASSETST